MFADNAAEYRQLIRLYVFADYYDFPALRRAIMSLLVSNNKEHHDYRVPHLPLLEDCLSQLPQNSPLYRWLAATWVEHLDDIEVYGADTRYLWHEMPMEFRLLFFDSYHHTRSLSEPCSCCHNACDYHEHESEEEWRRSKALLHQVIGAYWHIVNSVSHPWKEPAKATSKNIFQVISKRLSGISSRNKYISWIQRSHQMAGMLEKRNTSDGQKGRYVVFRHSSH